MQLAHDAHSHPVAGAGRGMRADMSAVADRVRSWRYAEGGKRDRRLDLLRGYCVVAMAVDHLGANSWFALLTGGNRFFASAAEAFVFLSGLVMGLVYRPLVARRGLGPAVAKALRRALLIYALTVAATLGFMGLSDWLDLEWAADVDVLATAAAVAQLRQTFYLTDVLLLYTVLIALAPLALALLQRGWTPVLLALSWGVWGVHQFEAVEVTWPAEDGFYYFAAWQVLFFTALAVGWHRDRVAAALGRVGSGRILAASAVGLALLVGLWAWAGGYLGSIDPATSGRIANAVAKWDLPPARLGACAVVFAVAYTLVDRCWTVLARGAGRLLLPLGEAALPAYVVHLLAIGLLAAAGERLVGEGGNLTRATTMLLQAAALVLVWLGVRAWTDPGRVVRSLPTRPAAVARLGVGVAVASLVLVGPVGVLGPMSPAASRVFAAEVVASPTAAAPVVATDPTPAPVAAAPSAVALAADRIDPVTLTIPSPSRVEERTFYSESLLRAMSYFVFVPQGYDTSARRYPVAYMLHGLGGSNTEWRGYNLLGVANNLIEAGEIPPMLIVLPQGDQSYWFDHVDGRRWGAYAAGDVVDVVDRTWRTLPDRDHRAVGGLSMGAVGALQLGMNYPTRSRSSAPTARRCATGPTAPSSSLPTPTGTRLTSIASTRPAWRAPAPTWRGG
jgi:hypothetical protein